MHGPAFPTPIAGLSGWSEAEADALLTGVARHLSSDCYRASRAGALVVEHGRGDRSPRSLRPPDRRGRLQRLARPGAGFPHRLLRARHRRLANAHGRVPDAAFPPTARAGARSRAGGAARRRHLGPSPRRRKRRAHSPIAPRSVLGRWMGEGLELAFVADPVDAFFAQVQGSARLRFDDGSETRIAYHGKTGHPYTAIGRVLIDRGWLPEGGATMQTIRAVLAANPEIVDDTLAANRSYVFFREREMGDPALGPAAAGGVPLVPLRSLAVDRTHIGLGTPVHIETTLPQRGPFAAVMIAEDAGSAIVGRARGDIFIGTGDAAGEIAGSMKASATWTMFLPQGVTPRLKREGAGAAVAS